MDIHFRTKFGLNCVNFRTKLCSEKNFWIKLGQIIWTKLCVSLHVLYVGKCLLYVSCMYICRLVCTCIYVNVADCASWGGRASLYMYVLVQIYVTGNKVKYVIISVTLYYTV